MIGTPPSFAILSNIIQLFPEGEVNSGGYIPRRGIYIHGSSPTLRGIVVLVFTKSDG